MASEESGQPRELQSDIPEEVVPDNHQPEPPAEGLVTTTILLEDAYQEVGPTECEATEESTGSAPAAAIPLDFIPLTLSEEDTSMEPPPKRAKEASPTECKATDESTGGTPAARIPLDFIPLTLSEEHTSMEPPSKRAKVTEPKRVFVVRHGEGEHQLRGRYKDWCVSVDPKLGPALTQKGVKQAAKAKELIAKELASAEIEAPPLIVSSNLLRALQTALAVAPDGTEVLVQPLLRERYADSFDDPSDLDALRVWLLDNNADERVVLREYEEALLEVLCADPGADMNELHPLYLQSCRNDDILADGVKQNKEALSERAAAFTTWLESQESSVMVIVGHAFFLGIVTNDKEWFENGEVRSYLLQERVWTREKKVGGGWGGGGGQRWSRAAPKAAQAVTNHRLNGSWASGSPAWNAWNRPAPTTSQAWLPGDPEAPKPKVAGAVPAGAPSATATPFARLSASVLDRKSVV